jgi:hypothetical protein
MSRLVNFGLGEVCDRVSILALKILYGESKSVDVQHFRNERAALMVKVLTRDGGRWIEYYSDLAAVNAAIWQAEEMIRGRREAITHTEDEGELAAHHYQAGALGLQIATLNDRRAALIQQINGFVGDDKAVEKV